jgi:hypothetical protein
MVVRTRYAAIKICSNVGFEAYFMYEMQIFKQAPVTMMSMM